MLSFDKGEDNFFDAYDEIRTSIDSSSSENSFVASQELELRTLEYELWTREPMSVQDRRKRFFRGMGFDELAPSPVGCSVDSVGCSTCTEESTVDLSVNQRDMERIMESSGPVSNGMSSPDVEASEDSLCCIRDLDSGRKFIVHELGQDGLPSMLKEVGSGKLITLHEFEDLLGLSWSAQKLLRREAAASGEKTACSLDPKKNKYLNWWRSFRKRRQCVGASKYDISVKKSKLTRLIGTRVHRYRKSCKDLTALYMGQEIQAHKGLIRTMKFSPTGRYLASGGEDCVVCIWQIIQVESSCACVAPEGSSTFVGKIKDTKLVPGKDSNLAPVLIPKKIFKIEETPLQELRGHTNDILDISWSKSNYLLTSSKDKTVRLWKVGCDRCLKIFQHKDYVTCIQFNPIEDRFFISGSIDGKVRIWEIPENRVTDWVDTKDIVTAICYQPDGKGFVVGSIKGDCRFYGCSAKMIQLDLQLSLCSKKKSSGKRITGLQFCPEDSRRIMITSADSRIRICDGVDVILKFKGHRKAKSQLSASFSSDGRHIISVGEDSNVYIWNYNGSGNLPCIGAKSIHSSEFFFSRGVSVAVPWPGVGYRETDVGNNTQISSLPHKILEPFPWLKNSDCFSLGTWLFSDGSSKMSATWPEEKLPSQTKPQIQPDHSCERSSHLHHDYWSLAHMAGTWNLVIVTAGNIQDPSQRAFSLNFNSIQAYVYTGYRQMAVFSPSLSLFPGATLSSFSSSSSFAPRLRAPSLMLGARSRTPPRSVVSCSSGLASDSPNYPRPQTATMAPFGLLRDEGSMPKPSYRWQRVLLKVSGEALAGDHAQNIDPKITMSIAREVASVTRLGIEVAIVVGGGNIFRGASWAGCSGLDRSSADYIGMLATVMNAIFLQATMESIGIPTRVQTAFRMSEVAEPYIRRRAVRHLEKGRVVIFAAGTGNPFFTTDTAAALRCAEINAEVVLKATNVDGVFEDDPRINPNARLLDNLTYQEVTSKDLSVMDMTAITLCQENNIPVVVFNLTKPGNIAKAIVGDKVGTFIGGRNQQQGCDCSTLAHELRILNEFET
ncbi:unnamed protein product [Musa banksii]